MEEKLYNIYYGENENDYIRRYLKDDDIINGYLSEAKAFELFFSDMIMCNNYFKSCDYDSCDILVDGYDEDEDYQEEEFQFFIVDPEFDEDITIEAVKKMNNTLYYDNEKELYIMGITDFGTMRTIVSTDLKVKGIQK